MAMIDSDILRMMMWGRCGDSDVEFNKGRARWDGGLWIRYKVFEECLAEAPVVDAEPRWIPCSERLPEYITSVLVQLTRTGDIFIGALVPNVDGTYTMWDLPNFSSYICLEDVTAWMPLPAPYKMDEVEE